MDDKKAFKILAGISIICCMCIIIFNTWIGPNMVPTYKEYREIFNLSSDVGDKIVKQNSDAEENEMLYNDLEEGEEDSDYDIEEDDDNDELVLVNINEADVDELMTLPNIGEVLAKRIIIYRQEYGPFESVEELLDIEGIGEKKLANIIDYICLE